MFFIQFLLPLPLELKHRLMKKTTYFSSFIMAATLCTMMFTTSSCSDNDDNKVVPPGETDDTEEYVIEVEKGMTMPENDFLRVPEVASDSDIVNALKAIDKVTDIKAFQLEERYDYYNEKMITKTAYYFNYKQDIDHNDPSKG